MNCEKPGTYSVMLKLRRFSSEIRIKLDRINKILSEDYEWNHNLKEFCTDIIG